MSIDRAAIAYEVGEEIEDACMELLGRDVGTIHRDEIGARALNRAALLIADAIEAERPKDTRARLPFDDGYDAAVCTAARLVRSLGGNDGSTPSGSVSPALPETGE